MWMATHYTTTGSPTPATLTLEKHYRAPLATEKKARSNQKKAEKQQNHKGPTDCKLILG